jgi:thymidylate synthase ThyX
MSPQRNVYLLDPKVLSPETIAVAFAKTSRSPLPFDEIARELSDEKSAQFHEKWVVGYGHASVAEHAVLHIAVENISRLAVESLESNRLASYTEKSTRYQQWERDSFFIPSELTDHPLRDRFVETCRTLFDAYEECLPIVKKTIQHHLPQKEDESPAAWERRTRSESTDVCRFLLPAASMANVGVTINARALEHAIRKALSHPLSEVRLLGEEIKEVALSEVPTLVKYAEAVPYLTGINMHLTAAASKISDSNLGNDWCRLAFYDPNMDDHVLAAALYRFGNISYERALSYVQEISVRERNTMAELILGELGQFDNPIRELEYTAFSFDIILDQGAYFELKRHRMMTQTPQALTADLGFAIPRMFTLAGLKESYRSAMEAARSTYEALCKYDPFVASYIVPNGYNRRILLNMNLRTAFHLISLRSAPNAHFSMRRISQRAAEEIRKVSPLLASYIRVNPDETWQEIEGQYFSQT